MIEIVLESFRSIYRSIFRNDTGGMYQVPQGGPMSSMPRGLKIQAQANSICTLRQYTLRTTRG